MLTETEFQGLLIFEPTVIKDDRGCFFESYRKESYPSIEFVQDNQSYSHFGVVRGLHYQKPPFAQTKLVKVLDGTILDVAVDIRETSPTFGKTFTIQLSKENKKQLLIPKGFAHGFCVLSHHAEVYYKCDAYYNKESEAGIAWDDLILNIDWIVGKQFIKVSEKDSNNHSFKDCYKFE